jgi:hypothetical protein
MGTESSSIEKEVSVAARIPIAVSSGSAHQVPCAALTKWFIARVILDEFNELKLCGYVYGHRRLRNGHPTMTSTLVEMSSDDSWARTLNTIYWLFDPVSAGSIGRSWVLCLPLLAMKCSGTNLERLRRVEGGVEWPHPRSPTTKYEHLGSN